MKIDNIISKIDPSRHAVYEMLDYVSDKIGIKLIQQKTADLFLFKTEPSIDSLYNYAHSLNVKLSEADLAEIENFFGEEKFRIKISENKDVKDLLLARGLKFKDSSYIMEARDLDRKDYSYSLPDNIKILPADNPDILAEVKMIFCEAYGCSPEAYDRKHGFLDQLMLNGKDKHIKTFILYENDIPVSTGAYYAFNNFSIENIGTRNSARGKGYAGLIMKTLLREAQKLNYSQACLVSSESGAQVYKNVGFEALAKNDTYIK